MDELLWAERDAIMTLGLLARTHFLFDQPIPLKPGTAPTHFAGLNVHCAVVDNTDGVGAFDVVGHLGAQKTRSSHSVMGSGFWSVLPVSSRRRLRFRCGSWNYVIRLHFRAQPRVPLMAFRHD